MNLGNQVSWEVDWKKDMLLDVKPPPLTFVFLLRSLDLDLKLFS